MVGAAAADSVNHVIVVGAGGASELELPSGQAYVGANVMVEWEAIEDWLELEIGASVLARAGAKGADSGLEWPVDILVKKPFRLAPWSEVMVGAGLEIVWMTGKERGAHVGGELAVDFMFWPWGRTVGLWIEPDSDFLVDGGVSHGLGMTAGVLLGW